MIEIEELSHDASRIHQDIVQLHDGYNLAVRRAKTYQGGMRWKKASTNGEAYLFRGSDRAGNGKTLGRRSAKTETIYSEFVAGRKKALSALKEINARLDEYARFAKAAKINRLPKELAKVLRAIELADLGKRSLIVGTNCVYAYEAAAGIRVLSAVLATQDVDILYDGRVKAEIIAEDLESINSAIKSADDTYEVAPKQTYRLVNGKYMIDLISPIQPVTKASVSVRGISIAEIEGLEWLVNSPKIDQVVVAHDGRSASMRVPIPEAFAAHKLWLSGRRGRQVDKQRRDRLQAQSVANIILNHMARKISMNALKAFPRKVAEAFIKFASDQD